MIHKNVTLRSFLVRWINAVNSNEKITPAAFLIMHTEINKNKAETLLSFKPLSHQLAFAAKDDFQEKLSRVLKFKELQKKILRALLKNETLKPDWVLGIIPPHEKTVKKFETPKKPIQENLFKTSSPIKTKYQQMDLSKNEWNQVTRILQSKLDNASDETLVLILRKLVETSGGPIKTIDFTTAHSGISLFVDGINKLFSENEGVKFVLVMTGGHSVPIPQREYKFRKTVRTSIP